MRGIPLFSLQGRLNRKPIWMYLIITVIIEAVLGGILSAVANPDDNTMLFTLSIPVGIIWLALSIIGLTYSVRRCHDRDRSGWFILLFLVPILNLWAMVEIYFLSGVPGSNKYGANPLNSGALLA